MILKGELTIVTVGSATRSVVATRRIADLGRNIIEYGQYGIEISYYQEACSCENRLLL